MSNRYEDVKVIKELFKIYRRSYAGTIPQHILDRMEISREVEYISDEVLYRFSAFLASKEEVDKEQEVVEKTTTSEEITVDFDGWELRPKTWWDMFKIEYFPFWLLSMVGWETELIEYNVTNNVNTTNHITQTINKTTAVYPDIPIPPGNNDYFIREHYGHKPQKNPWHAERSIPGLPEGPNEI